MLSHRSAVQSFLSAVASRQSQFFLDRRNYATPLPPQLTGALGPHSALQRSPSLSGRAAAGFQFRDPIGAQATDRWVC